MAIQKNAKTNAMTEIYHKTFWQNEHQFEVPEPIEEWPTKAKYLTVDISRKITFWTEKPTYNNGVWEGREDTIIGDSMCSYSGSNIDIWERPY